MNDLLQFLSHFHSDVYNGVFILAIHICLVFVDGVGRALLYLPGNNTIS